MHLQTACKPKARVLTAPGSQWPLPPNPREALERKCLRLPGTDSLAYRASNRGKRVSMWGQSDKRESGRKVSRAPVAEQQGVRT